MARMRTIDSAHAELLMADPDCELTKTALRRMVVSGQIPSARIGRKYLIDVDKLPEYIFQLPVAANDYGSVRRIAI